MNPWLRYSLVRLGIFGAVFGVLGVLGITWWLAAIFATVISFTVGYIFFSDTRQELVRQLSTRAQKKRTSADEDAHAEDM